jgi:glycosyltransferase involved in cell wall biosynthesis
MDGVDIVLLTLNSERKLEACLNSVYANVPVANLIAVDGGSKDGTLRILADFHRKYGNVQVIHDKGTRATARQKGIDAVTSEWFVFVDSDVVLCRNWYQKAQKLVADDVGAVWGTEVWSTLKDPRALKMFLLVTRKIFDYRGGTHDTLIRTSTVRDINIPSDLHVFEDAYIKDYIAGKGYRVVAAYDPFCIHFRPESVWTFQGSLNIIVDAVRHSTPKLFAKLLLAYGFYTAYSVSQLLGNNTSKKPR